MTFRRIALLLPLAIVFGCNQAPTKEASAPIQSGANDLALALDHYGKAKSYTGKSTVTLTIDGKTNPFSTRVFSVEMPNKFAVSFDEKQSVGGPPRAYLASDGKSVIEGTDVHAYKYRAPSALHDYQHLPILASWSHGTLLPIFFGGAEAVRNLAASDPVIDGHETIGGIDCKVLKFTGRSFWGTTTLAIDMKTGLVVRMRAKLEPLLKAAPENFPNSKEVVFEETFTDQKLDATVDPKTFEVKAAPKARVDTGLLPREWLKVGQPAPGINIKRADGSDFSLAALKGKVVFLDLWATWCGPCKQTLPSTQALFERHKNDDLVVLAITDESVEVAMKYMKGQGFTMPVGIDPAKSVSLAYGAAAIPKFVVIDRKGNIAAAMDGAYEGFDRDLDGVVEKALAAKA